MGKSDKLSREGFKHLVGKALATLPQEFQGYLENVVVIIEGEPPDDMPDVMGLYEGVPLVERSMDDTILPDCITLYKGPIERACRTSAEIETEVRTTILHEIGHFFGLNEEQMETLEVKKDVDFRGTGRDNLIHLRDYKEHSAVSPLPRSPLTPVYSGDKYTWGNF